MWLASYPKTGSTWLRQIVNQIIAPDLKAKDSIPSYQKTFPLDALEHQFPHFSTSIIKTHMYPDNPRMNMEIKNTIGFITIHRHPLDIMLSSLNYSRVKERHQDFIKGRIKTVEEIISDGEIKHYIEQFIKNDGIVAFHGTSGKWSKYKENIEKNVTGKIKHLSLCYEEMVADPHSVVTSIFSFFEIEHTKEIIGKIVSDCEKKTALDGHFFWKKKAFNFRDILATEHIEFFSENFKAELRKNNY